MSTPSRFVTPAVWIFYLAIAFEFLFMITPFALYFYSAYAPALQWLNASPATAWLSAFFLPHFSATRSGLLNGLNTAGWMFAYLGLVLFLVSALQLYGAKLFRRGAVTGWLYRHVRHPQYLALAILGLGVTLIWPRFLVLLSFVTMLFLYRTLGRFEEQRCLARYGEPYARYQRETGMFLPRIRRARAGAVQTPGLRPLWYSLAAYLAAVLLTLALGLGLREHTLSSVSAVYGERVAILSPALLARAELQSAHELASSAPEAESLARLGIPAMLVYVVPSNWYMPDLPIDTHEVVRQRGGHGAPADFGRSRFRVLFARVRSHADVLHGRDILRKAQGMDPLLIVDIELASRTVTGVSEPPDSVIWGDISPPLL